ncbi:hypothetical protein P4O66_002396 [Electrophorus voltai]|uniref:Glypican-1 n=1 Tax=Electrophorus voltai TaxID=2609070 RepID=A0AAD8Z0G6_9TELE|nr:hypothetical protein P4O66_002396 [Electrophorus voltai]
MQERVGREFQMIFSSRLVLYSHSQPSKQTRVLLWGSPLARNTHGYFLELLNRSEVSLQDSFSASFGSLFTQMSSVFHELYSDLRHYYRGANLNLEEALNEFWARLLERLVRALSGEHTLSEDYLECLAKQAETLHPFGDTPHELKSRVTRMVVAARFFVQGLVVAGEVVRKVSQVRGRGRGDEAWGCGMETPFSRLKLCLGEAPEK